MKIDKLKKLLLMLVILVISSSCSTDKINVTLVEGPAPSELSTTVVVSQDNSGNVTVFPVSVGASSYRVYFGDAEEESPVVLGKEKSTVHAYKEEGDYIIRVIAVAPNDKTSEESFAVTVVLEALLNFVSGVTVNEDDISEITFTPSADNAVSFEILFGDVPNEEATIIEAGETVTHQYPNFGVFTVTFRAIGADGRTAEFTEEVSAGDPLGFPINFDLDTVTYNFLTFNGANYVVVENPDPSGANDEISKVGAITNTGNAFEGGVMPLDTPIDFNSSNKTITMKFWSNVAVPVLLKFEEGVNGERQNEVIVMHSGTGWEVLEFNFATSSKKSYIDGNQGFGEAFVPTGQYAQFAIFVDGPGTTSGTFYMDDLIQVSSDNGNTNSDCSTIITTPISFEASEVFSPFNGASYTIVDNPDTSGANNTASKVGALTNAGGAFEGYSLILGTTANFSGDNKVLKLKFWSNVNAPIRLDMDNGVSGARSVEVNVTHGGTGWEELSFDFNTAVKTYIDGNQGFGEPLVPTGEYGGITIFIDGPGTTAGTFYIDDIGICNDSSGGGNGSTTSVFSAPISFEASETFNPFNGASYTIVDNPDLSGANTTASKVGALTNSGGAFEGYSLAVDTPVNFSGDNKTVTMKFWSNVSVPIRLDMDNGINDARSVEVNVTHGGTGWEELTFDFNTAVKIYIDGNQGFGEPLVPAGEYGGITIFIDGPGTTAGTFYIDDIN